jgi:LysM repeat protein
MKSRALFTLFIILAVMSLSGCQLSQSAAPQATPTTIPADASSLFPATAIDMGGVESLLTQTAQAGGPTATIDPFGPTSSVLITPNVTATPTVPALFNTTTTPTVDLSALFPTTTTQVAGAASATATSNSVVIVATSTPAAVTSRPSTYTLQKGEFPYCIARRFNVNPDELLTLNGLTDGGLFEAGLVLKIPQTGNPFPASRSLHAHPTTYTVTGADETIYGVACYFGDLDPNVIASTNNLAVSAVLTIGQKLTIP